MSTPDPTVPDPAPGTVEVVTVADEVAELVTEALDAGEAVSHAAVKVPFGAARLAVEKLRKAADALEMQLRRATGKK